MMIRCALFAVFLTVAACSKDQQQPLDNSTPHLARIEINPSAALLTGAGQSHAFTAQAFDQNGLPIAATFTWSSSNAAAVSVDASGNAQSLLATGSTQLSATAAGVTSSAATVVVAQPAAGAVLIQDAQVVSGPDAQDPDHGLELGAISTLTVHGVTGLAPGVILIAAESAAVAGRVVSVADAGGGNLLVTLQQVSIGELLQHYSVDLQFALKDEDSTAPALAAQRRTADTNPSAEWGALQCTIGGSLSLTGASFTYTLKHSLTTTVHLDETVAMAKLTGTLTATFKGTVQLQGTLTGTASCKLEVAREIIPLGGPLAALLALQVPSGVKAELSITVKTTPGVQFGFEGKAISNLTAGVSCTRDGLCTNLTDADFTTTELKPIATADGVKSFRIEGSLGLYGYVGLDVGSPIAQKLHLLKPLGILEAKLGAKQDFTFGSKDDQATDESYASKYELKIAGSIGLVSSAVAALKKLDIPMVGIKPSVGFDKSLDKSPDGTDKADKTTAKVGEAVALTVNLAAEHLKYVGIGYNVGSIQFYRKKPGKDLDAAPLGTVTASSGQSEFTYTWTPGDADSGTNLIYAYVITSPTSIPLEVAIDSKLSVTVAGSGQITIAVKGSRTENTTYSSGTGSEASDIDLVFDLELQDKPVFGGGMFGVPYEAFYTLTPAITGTVSHDGRKQATGLCDICVPASGSFTDDNVYDATGDASAGPAPVAKTSFVFIVPSGTNGTLNGALPAVQLSGAGQGHVSITGCDDPPVNQQLTALPVLGPIAFPGDGIHITGVDPTATTRLTGTLTYADSMVVGFPSSQTGSSATWSVPVTVTITYDLPYAPAVTPLRFSGGSNLSAAPTVEAPVVTTAATPLYLGRRPTRSGHSEPALISRGEPSARAVPDCLR